MKTKKIIFKLFTIIIFIYISIMLYEYYSPPKERQYYRTTKHDDDTLRIAYIGDSWALGHSGIWTFGPKPHSCQISNIITDSLHKPVIIESYGIGGLTSKNIYYAFFDVDSFNQFLKEGYDYCFISAGINDTYCKMSISYYKQSINLIIRFLLNNHIHPIILEIPDYNIFKAFEKQKINKKLIRHLSMFVNETQLDCKQQFRDALDELIDKVGGMDLLFYASGVGNQNMELEPDIELKTVNTNGLGFTRMIGAAYRYMAAHGGGHIAAISSIAGTKGLGAAPSYSATKAFQSTYLQALEQQANMRGLNIRFTDLRPGFVATPLLGDTPKYPMLLETKKVAHEMVYAVNHHKHVRVIDWRWSIATAMWRRIPKWLWRRLNVK